MYIHLQYCICIYIANIVPILFGMTQRILQIRLNEHIKSSTSAIYNHIHETKHNINFTSPHILANDQVKLRLQIKETLDIKEQTAYKSLNQNTGSFPLMLW